MLRFQFAPQYVPCLSFCTWLLTGMAALLLAGCASGGPKPASLVRQGTREYKKDNTEAALAKFQQVIDTAPGVFEKRRFWRKT